MYALKSMQCVCIYYFMYNATRKVKSTKMYTFACILDK